MTEKKQVWKCSVCGNIIEVLHKGMDALVCCEVPMGLQVEHGVGDEGKDHRSVYPELRSVGVKHVPVIDGKKVKVGSVAHPMEEGHYIEWIEVFPKEGRSLRVFLGPGDLPEVEVCFEPKSARAYCNLHGLWISSG